MKISNKNRIGKEIKQLSMMKYTEVAPSRAAERGAGGAICPRPQGVRGLIIEDFSILSAENALKCILSQSKGHDQKILLLASLAGASAPSFVPGSPEVLFGPGATGDWRDFSLIPKVSKIVKENCGGTGKIQPRKLLNLIKEILHTSLLYLCFFYHIAQKVFKNVVFEMFRST